MMVHNREGTSTRPLRGFARTLGAGALATFAALAACAAEPSSPPAAIPVVLAADATPAEVTAANELAAYLGRMTGRLFPVLAEAETWIPWPGSTVYVGPTAFAKANGVDCVALGAEEWALKSVDQKLIVAGGRPRGTLYAAYRLLEDHCGVRWWTPWEETTPVIADFKLPSVDSRGKPAFDLRWFTAYGPGGPHGQGAGPFCARNRLNNNGGQISKEYGGGYDFGPPFHVHTLGRYVPSAECYDKHPDWFALVGGKRAHGGLNTYNLCLTKPELRQFILERLRYYIAKSREDAAKAGRPEPVMFDVSYNEAPTCECPQCKALEDREGGAAGPLLDLVNYLADSIREQYPNVFLETLAYGPSQKNPPRTIKARDNVIVRFCDDLGFISKPITDPDNTTSREALLAWMPVCKNLHLWRYGISYGQYSPGGPMATAQAYAQDMRFYVEHGIKGVFQEHEGGIPDDMRDMKLWLLAKLMEDPSRDYQALLKDFTDGYYGAAGAALREYLAALQAAQEAGTPPTTFSAPLHLTHLDGPFLAKAHSIFDEAEKRVTGNPLLALRVRHARLALDRATLALFSSIQRNWDEAEAMPLDRAAIAARAKDTWITVLGLRFPLGLTADTYPDIMRHVDVTMQKPLVENEFARLLRPRREVALPERFRDLPKGTVWDYTPEDFRQSGYQAPTTPDTDAETGLTVRMELTDDGHPSVKRQKLPITWGLYDLRALGAETEHPRAIRVSADIQPEEVLGPGYHWFKLPTVSLRDGGHYVYFKDPGFWCPVTQCDLDVPSRQRDGAFDIWARIKFEGPDFPHGDAGTEEGDGGMGDLAFPKEWTVFGPVAKADPEPDFAGMQDIPAELNVAGKRLTGQQAMLADSRVDLGALCGGKEVGKTVYLLATLDAEKEGECKLGAGADWWMKWWVNGEAVYDTLKEGNGAWPPSVLHHVFTTRLKAGRNLVAVKVVSGSGSFALAAGGPRERREEKGRKNAICVERVVVVKGAKEN